MRSFVVEAVSEGVDERLEPVDAAGQFVAGAELVSPRGLGVGALDAFEEGHWGRRYPAIGQSWRWAWSEVMPFYAFPADVRRSSTPPTRSKR